MNQEEEKRFMTHYGLYKFNEVFHSQNNGKKRELLEEFISKMEQAAETCFFHLVYPARNEYDILVWSNTYVHENHLIAESLTNLAKVDFSSAEYISLKHNMWGVTKPSVYSRAKKSSQELDPFSQERKEYFVIYPFTKTTEWYLKSREERQEMMNEHIRIGKQYLEISQLLIYSFGMQDQEFVVAYEMDNLPLFSDLVYELRGSQARLYTLVDTPIITSLRKSKEDLVNIICGEVGV